MGIIWLWCYINIFNSFDDVKLVFEIALLHMFEYVLIFLHCDAYYVLFLNQECIDDTKIKIKNYFFQ